MNKKMQALVLALVMCLGMLPVTVLADGEDTPAEAVSYTVTFDANGGEFPLDMGDRVSFQTADQDGKALIDPPFTRPMNRNECYFVGWYRAGKPDTLVFQGSDSEIDAAIKAYDFSQDDGTTFVAKWVWFSHTITFNAGGGAVSPEKAATNDEGKLSIELPTPTRDGGYSFNGWHNSRGGELVTNDTVYDRDTTLWAEWSIIETAPYRVNFHPNGGWITQLNGVTVPPLTLGEPPFYTDAGGLAGVDSNSGLAWSHTDNDGRLASLPAAERDGYEFDCWRYSLSGSNTSVITTQTVFDAGATVYATWKKTADTCTVTFNLNTIGQLDDPKPLTLKKGEKIELPDAPKWEGYIFRGWYSGTVNNKTHILENAVEWEDGDTVAEDVTIYALWQKKDEKPDAPTIQPTKPVIEVEDIPTIGTAYASIQTVTVDGEKVEFRMYALKDAIGNPTNYIKLRDMAYILNGTKAQFAVGYDGTISLTTGNAYMAGGTEMTTPFSGDRSYKGGAQTVKVNGEDVAMTAITLTDDNGGDYNYFKLRDLGKALGFNVGWDNGVFIESDKTYTE